MEFGSSRAREGDIDWTEPFLVIDKAVRCGAVAVETDNLAPVVDANRLSLRDTREGNVDSGEPVTGTICVSCLRVRPGHDNRGPEGERNWEKRYWSSHAVLP
jgi:hypothetical protein